jgi:phosphate transport system substrate-binding protein
METNERTAKSDLVLIITVLLVIVLLGAAVWVRAGEEELIVIKGSDAMVHLVGDWAEEFMKQNPNIEVVVTGEGSGTGIVALINSTMGICGTSSEMKEKEEEVTK